jgi:hypothetical protein
MQDTNIAGEEVPQPDKSTQICLLEALSTRPFLFMHSQFLWVKAYGERFSGMSKLANW